MHFGDDSLAFCHSLASRFGAVDQIVAMAHIIASKLSDVRVVKRRSSSRSTPVFDFVAERLDATSFVSLLTPSSAISDAFVQMYSAVLSLSESDAGAKLVIQNLIAVASLPSFVANLGALMDTRIQTQHLRRRALQLLNEKLERVRQTCVHHDEIVPVLDALIPDLLTLIESPTEPAVNKQLVLLVGSNANYSSLFVFRSFFLSVILIAKLAFFSIVF